MGDKDPRDCHKILATLQPSFVMPELDTTRSSWSGHSFPSIDILHHNPALWPQSAFSKTGLRLLFLVMFSLQDDMYATIIKDLFSIIFFLHVLQQVLGEVKVKALFLRLGGNSDCLHLHICIVFFFFFFFLKFSSAERRNQTANKTNEIYLH